MEFQDERSRELGEKLLNILQTLPKESQEAVLAIIESFASLSCSKEVCETLALYNTEEFYSGVQYLKDLFTGIASLDSSPPQT